MLAPFIGGFIVMSHLGWRWTEYIVAIMGGVAFLLNLFFLSESYPPVILVSKAAELRRRTKNWGIHAKQEEIEIDLRELLEKNFSRPLRMLVSEPIVLLLSIYMSFLYGILYLLLTAFPLVFQGVHRMNLGVGGMYIHIEAQSCFSYPKEMIAILTTLQGSHSSVLSSAKSPPVFSSSSANQLT